MVNGFEFIKFEERETKKKKTKNMDQIRMDNLSPALN